MSDEQVTLDMFTTEELELELELRRKLEQLTEKQLCAEIQRRNHAIIFDLTGLCYGEIKVNNDGHITHDYDDFQGTMILIHNG